MSMELDHLDSLAAKTYDGFLVRKDLVRKYARQYPVPTYVVEFLLGRYCASVNEAEIAEGLAIVEQQLKACIARRGRRYALGAQVGDRGVHVTPAPACRGARPSRRPSQEAPSPASGGRRT